MSSSPERTPVEGLVSVVVPVRNRPRLLVEAVESALRQSHPQVELLIVDDASTDATPETIAALQGRDPTRVRSIRNDTNLGPGPCREIGRVAARGEFLQFLDSDDLLLARKLELQVAALRARPEADVAYGWTRLRHPDGHADPRPFKRSGERFDAIFPAFLAGRVWNTVTPLYRSAPCARVGAWTDLWLEEDWEYDCRLGALGAQLVQVEEWVCEYRLHEEPHLGRGDALDPARLSQQARAHRLIEAHARRAGIGPAVPEMAHFARALFLLARRCGAAGLREEAATLFALARESSTPERARGWDFRLVSAISTCAGWRAAGRFSLAVDSARKARGAGASPAD